MLKRGLRVTRGNNVPVIKLTQNRGDNATSHKAVLAS